MRMPSEDKYRRQPARRDAVPIQGSNPTTNGFGCNWAEIYTFMAGVVHIFESLQWFKLDPARCLALRNWYPGSGGHWSMGIPMDPPWSTGGGHWWWNWHMPWRIHGAGIYANTTGGILMGFMAHHIYIYSSTVRILIMGIIIYLP